MKTDVAIIGAGPAGLTAAYLLSKNQVEVTILEADPVYVGGISRTATYKGFHFDIGGHRFFSKCRRWKIFGARSCLTICWTGHGLPAFSTLENFSPIRSNHSKRWSNSGFFALSFVSFPGSRRVSFRCAIPITLKNGSAINLAGGFLIHSSRVTRRRC